MCAAKEIGLSEPYPLEQAARARDVPRLAVVRPARERELLVRHLEAVRGARDDARERLNRLRRRAQEDERRVLTTGRHQSALTPEGNSDAVLGLRESGPLANDTHGFHAAMIAPIPTIARELRREPGIAGERSFAPVPRAYADRLGNGR